MVLTGSQFKQLQDVLLDAFRDQYSLDQMVRFSLDQSLDVISGTGPLGHQIYKLITWAEAHNKLEELVRGALIENGGNIALIKFANEFLHRGEHTVSGWGSAVEPSSDKNGTAEERSRQQRPLELCDVFICHYFKERDVALRLKEFLEYGYQGSISVQLSATEGDSSSQDVWDGETSGYLATTQIVLVLFSADSIDHHRLHVEAGGALLRFSSKFHSTHEVSRAEEIAIIPLLHRGFDSANLPIPYKRLPALSLEEQGSIEALLQRIDRLTGRTHQAHSETCLKLAADISTLGHQVDAELHAHKHPHDHIRFYLYSKSVAQYQLNREITSPHAFTVFRKPYFDRVFHVLHKNGQPDVSVVSLDEYWITPLADKKRLRDLTKYHTQKPFLDLFASSAWHPQHKKYYSVPWYADFSYYLYNNRYKDALRRCLLDLSVSDRIEGPISDMKKIMRNRGGDEEHLLLYDFPTQENHPSVLIEFIEAFGEGVTSLLKRETMSNPRNVKALRILRTMVGERDIQDFVRDEPLNFDGMCRSVEVAFIRDWHSRFSDMRYVRDHYTPDLDCPIRGTLGGWHVGILANVADDVDWIDDFKKLFRRDEQLKRLKLKAGIPTLAQIYDSPTESRLPDPITRWNLTQVRHHMEGLHRRSRIADYMLCVRPQLMSLHSYLMNLPTQYSSTDDIRDMLNQWAQEIQI